MRWTSTDLVTLGYVAIRPRRSPLEFAAKQYFVCSPASCIVDEPIDWPAQLNAVWMVDSVDALDPVLRTQPDRSSFLVLGLRGLPDQIGSHRDGWALDWQARSVSPAPIPQHFVRLGYDVCSRYAQSTLEHSPLSCNGLADTLGANRYCLFETFDSALLAAERFARDDDAEPGPYVLLDVWAERRPEELDHLRARAPSDRE